MTHPIVCGNFVVTVISHIVQPLESCDNNRWHFYTVSHEWTKERWHWRFSRQEDQGLHVSVLSKELSKTLFVSVINVGNFSLITSGISIWVLE